MLIRLLQHLFIHCRLDPRRINRAIHILKQHPTPHQRAPNHATMLQHLQETRHVLRLASYKANYRNDPARPDSIKGLSDRGWAADFDHMVNASVVVGELLGGLTPVGVGFVVDNVGTELLESGGFGVAASGGDDARASGFGELGNVS